MLLLLSMPITNAMAAAAGGYTIVFDPNRFTVKSATLDGKLITYRAYENLVYVRNPVETGYQTLNVFVPMEYYEGKQVGGYKASTAPIFLPNSVGGYMPGRAGSPGQDRDGRPNASLVALSRGYVVAAPGARGRTNVDGDGRYTGKAPACIVDLKAAVRYLRFNDRVMPGNAEKIVSNGTSAGGALSALLGASGNSPDYEPYLKAIGAAEARDDIFAVSAYCPITNLDNADTAYEWLFNGVTAFTGAMFPAPPAEGAMPASGPDGASQAQGSLTADQIRVSDMLKAQFPAYVNSLKLKKPDGTILSLDADGNGSFKDYVLSLVIASAQKALDSGTDLSALAWITVKDGTVTAIDFGRYAGYATRMKAPPAFDGLDLGTGENDLFGGAAVNARHFTAFGKDHGTAGGTLAEAAVVRMMNPMGFIGAKGTSTAKYWRIRHGTADRDTSLAVPVILATKLANSGCTVDLALPWAQPHGGDYDLDELFAWMARVCRD